MLTSMEMADAQREMLKRARDQCVPETKKYVECTKVPALQFAELQRHSLIHYRTPICPTGTARTSSKHTRHASQNSTRYDLPFTTAAQLILGSCGDESYRKVCDDMRVEKLRKGPPTVKKS